MDIGLKNCGIPTCDLLDKSAFVTTIGVPEFIYDWEYQPMKWLTSYRIDRPRVERQKVLVLETWCMFKLERHPFDPDIPLESRFFDTSFSDLDLGNMGKYVYIPSRSNNPLFK